MNYIQVHGYATWHLLESVDEGTNNHYTACGWNVGPCQVHMTVLPSDRLQMPISERVCQRCRDAELAAQGIKQLSLFEATA